TNLPKGRSLLCVPNLAKQPGASIGPVTFCRRERESQYVGRIFRGQSREVFEFHEFGLLRGMGGQFLQRIVYGEQLVIVARRGDRNILNWHVFLSATMPLRPAPASVINQDATHGLCGSGKEMRSIGPG